MCKDLETMELYNKFRSCPKEAQRPIQAGRLKGKTDINPMWRLKMLTEVFGPCGFGWTLRIVRMWIEDGAEKRQYNDRGELIGSNVEKTANVEIALRVNDKGEWSEDIPGIGGAMFVELESRGFNTEDEAYKKAYTDAISVACKALGIAADIYFANDPDSKYDTSTQGQTQPQSKPAQKAQNATQNTQKPQGAVNTRPALQNAAQRAPATTDVPFPEVAGSPSGGGIVTFQEACEMVMPSGQYAGEKLTDVYKKDLKYLRTMCKMPGTDQKIIGAVSALDNAVIKSREAQNVTA